MKIYPGKHDIVSTNNIDISNDVQIAYLENEDFSFTSSVQSDFSVQKMEPIVPYSTIDGYKNIICVNNDGDLIYDTEKYFTRISDDTYQYVPPESNEFQSISIDEFTYSVTAKRNGNYDNLKNYYIDIQAYDSGITDANNTSIIDKIRSIFMLAGERSLCPKNIVFSNNDVDKFIYDDSNTPDFIFAESSDGLTIGGQNIYDFNQNSSSNIWVIVDDNNFPTSSHPVDLYDYSASDRTFSMSCLMYNKIDYDSSVKLFLSDRYKSEYDNSIITYSSGAYSPLMIKEDSKNKRYIIYSPASMFNNITPCVVGIIMEHVLRIYLSSYIKTLPYTSWVSDIIPDYIVLNSSMVKFSQFKSNINIYEMFKESSSDIVIHDITVSNDNVDYSVDAYGFIVFSKKYTNNIDLKKPDGYIAIYCHNKKIIFYKHNIYKKQSNISDCLNYEIANSRLSVSIDNYIDSFNGIHIHSYSNNLGININKTGSVCIVYNHDDGNIIIDYLENIVFDNINNYTILCSIRIGSEKKSDRSLYDIRVRGGGLPGDIKNDTQSLFDIGSIKGVSYRKGGSIIIKLPMQFKKYDNIIRSAVEKHMNANAHAFIIYYDEEEK